MLDLRSHFSRFLSADPGRLHVAAHSHHPWPDATREAQLAAWDEAAQWMDAKWERAVLGRLFSDCQGHVARHLNLPDPSTVVFAPNTHEFAVRILSALPLRSAASGAAAPRVLTTDGEFHSFARQATRLEEDGLLRVVRIPSEPGSLCLSRLIEAVQSDGPFDLIWVSEVFFGSGFALDLDGIAALAEAAGEATEVVVDGYHAFMARPVNLSRLARRVFYTAGGYKYAMAGEGAAFLHAPPGRLLRPRATGWFAAFGALAGTGGDEPCGVPYAEGGWRFMGATFDPCGLYRLDAAMRWLEEIGITAADVHAHAHALQARFVAGLEGTGLDPARLVVPVTDTRRGNFLAFDLPDAEAWQARLGAAGVVTDRRGTRLRFGFGLYHTEQEIDGLLERLRRLASRSTA